MVDKTEGLKIYAEEKTRRTLEKVDNAIRNISLRNEQINFNSVAKESTVSKSFLYNNPDIRERIEGLRRQQVNKEINQRARTEKSSKAKDIMIMAKDKRIKELENENKRLKEQLETLRGKLYCSTL
jgi:hypothetical protein